MPHQDPNQLLTVLQVADKLSVSSAFVLRQLRVNPDFPTGLRLGRLRKWKAGDIDAYVAKLNGEISSLAAQAAATA